MSSRHSMILMVGAAIALLGMVVGVFLLSLSAGSRLGHSTPDAKDLEQMRTDATRLFDGGEFGRAETLVRQVLVHDRTAAESHKLLGEILLGQGKTLEAYRALTESLQYDESTETVFFTGVVATKARLFDEAVAHHTRAVEIEPNQAKHLIYKGTSLLNVGRFEEAEKLSNVAKQLDASISEGYLLRAKIREHHGDDAGALAMIHKALELAPDTSEGRELSLSYVVYKAQLLRKTGDAGQGVNLILALSADQRYRIAPIEELVACYMAIDQPQKAAVVWADLLAVDATNARAAAEAGICLVQAGSMREARRYLEMARTLDPNHDAVARLERAIRKGPPTIPVAGSSVVGPE